MPLGNLARLLERLTASPPSSGLANRKAFNADPTTYVNGLQAAELKALLSFEKANIALAVLEQIARPDPSLRSSGNDVRDFILWLYELSRWDFDPSEESEYAFGFTPPAAGLLAAYPDPVCEITAVRIASQGSAGPQGTQLDLEIYGQGFLPGKSIVTIVAEGSGATVFQQRIEPDAGSTFRGARIQVNKMTLPQGTYRASVGIDLGDGSLFPIERPVANTRFTVS